MNHPVDELLSLPRVRSLIPWPADFVIGGHESALVVNGTVVSLPVSIDVHKAHSFGPIAEMKENRWAQRAIPDHAATGAFDYREIPQPYPYYELGVKSEMPSVVGSHSDDAEIQWENEYWRVEAAGIVSEYQYHPRIIFNDLTIRTLTHKKTGETMTNPERSERQQFSVFETMLRHPEASSVKYEREETLYDETPDADQREERDR